MRTPISQDAEEAYPAGPVCAGNRVDPGCPSYPPTGWTGRTIGV
jgi:hypothetical protein